MAKATNRSPLFSSCSLLMASLFAYSASVQLNDPDWYLWLPLYASASAVNLLHTRFTSKATSTVAKLALRLGIILFLKVVLEDHVYGLAGFWSLDMGERVVREKLGTGLVVASMFLQSKASTASETEPVGRKREEEAAGCVEYGMMLLVVLSLGLSLYFFVFVNKGDEY